MTTTTSTTRMLASFLLLLVIGVTTGFAPMAKTAFLSTPPTTISSVWTKSQLHMGVFSEKDRDKLTRDTEPEEFFKTNTDKMTDQEKIPIAIAGIAFIALPFIAGLIALYASK